MGESKRVKKITFSQPTERELLDGDEDLLELACKGVGKDPWRRNFVDTVREQLGKGKGLSEKQFEVLQKIALSRDTRK